MISCQSGRPAGGRIREGAWAFAGRVTTRRLHAGGKLRIYAALDRMEQKGYVTSLLGDRTPERGGRAKRYFRVTSTGLRAIKMTRTALTNLWSGLPVLEGRRS